MYMQVPPAGTLLHTFAPQTLAKAALWWPRELGAQPLYTLSVHAKCAGTHTHTNTHTHI